MVPHKPVQVNERLVNNNHKPGLQAITETPNDPPGEPPGQKKADKNVRLNAKQTFALNNELIKQRGHLEAEGMSLSRAAAYFSVVMGFTVTQSAVVTAKEATGVTWKTKAKQPKRGAKVLYSSRVLAQTLSDLLQELGKPVPEAVAKIVRGEPLNPPEKTAGGE